MDFLGHFLPEDNPSLLPQTPSEITKSLPHNMLQK
jgi:hypothetical protein